MSRTLKDPILADIVDRSLTTAEAGAAQREGAVLTMDTAAAFARTALEKLAGEPTDLMAPTRATVKRS